MLNQKSKRFLRNPKFWHIVVLSLALIAMCQYFGIQNVTNQITYNDNNDNFPCPSGTNNPNSFISTWNTSINTGYGSSNATEIKLPLVYGGQYNFIVQWGDGSSSTITAYNQNAVTHDYASSGVYTVNITGQLKGWKFYDDGNRQKLIGISQWGNINLGNLGSYFYGCSNLVLTATDALNLTGTTDLSSAFANCAQLGGSGDMNGWDVSNVTEMSEMFAGASTFNQPVGNWNVSSVIDTDFMFQDDSAFNQPIGNWNVSSVTNMNSMFYGDSAFNQPIGNWNVSSVTDMDPMFNCFYSSLLWGLYLCIQSIHWQLECFKCE